MQITTNISNIRAEREQSQTSANLSDIRAEHEQAQTLRTKQRTNGRGTHQPRNRTEPRATHPEKLIFDCTHSVKGKMNKALDRACIYQSKIFGGVLFGFSFCSFLWFGCFSSSCPFLVASWFCSSFAVCFALFVVVCSPLPLSLWSWLAVCLVACFSFVVCSLLSCFSCGCFSSFWCGSPLVVVAVVCSFLIEQTTTTDNRKRIKTETAFFLFSTDKLKRLIVFCSSRYTKSRIAQNT